MRVLHIVSWYSTYHAKELRTGIFHNEQVRAFDAPYNVAIWFPYDDTVNDEFTAEEEWGVLTFRSNVRGGFFRQIKTAIKTFEKIREYFPPDLIHAHVAGQAGLIACLLNIRFGVPYIISEHMPIEMFGKINLKRRIKYSAIYGLSRINTCVSDDLNERLTAIFPYIKFKTVYNGVVDPKIILEREKNEIYYRVSNSVNIVIVAILYDKDIKGFQYLLPAIKILNENNRGEKIVLHICGGGKYLSYYIKMASKLGISKYCIFYGSCEKNKLFKIVSQMDFGISASLYESAGVAIEEMLLLGKPVVVTKAGGTNSLVSKDNSIVVNKGSVRALVNGINRMSNTYMNFDGEKIRNDALKKYNVHRITKKYEKIYDSSYRLNKK